MIRSATPQERINEKEVNRRVKKGGASSPKTGAKWVSMELKTSPGDRLTFYECAGTSHLVTTAGRRANQTHMTFMGPMLLIISTFKTLISKYDSSWGFAFLNIFILTYVKI